MEKNSSNADLIRKLFQEMGGNPSDILIQPADDDLAPGYRVMTDDKRVTITRLDIQDRNLTQIRKILRRLL